MMMRQRELGAEQRLQDLELEPIHRGDSHEPIHNSAQQAFHSIESPPKLAAKKNKEIIVPYGMMMMTFICSFRNKNEPTAIYPPSGYSPPRNKEAHVMMLPP